MEDKKFKNGKYCGFREKNQCNEFCGLYCVGLGGCVFHSINMNLRELIKGKEIKKEEVKE